MATRKPTTTPATGVAATPRTKYNAAYAVLFRHREMVHALLRFVLPRSIHETIDPAGTFKRLPIVYHTDALAERDGDTAFGLSFLNPCSPLLALLEFQSTADSWMSLRMLTYTALAWEQWVQDADELPHFLPPVVGMVLYNGSNPWREPAHTTMRPGVTLHGITSRIELRDRRAVGALQSEGWYYLVDIERLERLEHSSNLAAFLFRLERCKTVDHLVPVVDALVTRLDDEKNRALDKAFAAFILEVLRNRDIHIEGKQLNSLLRIKTMLEGHEQWKQDLVDKGAKQAMQQGAATFVQSRLGRGLTASEQERLAERITDQASFGALIALNSPAEITAWLQGGTNGRRNR